MSIGEILDRAISTYVRRCLPLFVILAITVVPVLLIQLAGVPGFAHMGELLAQMNRLPPTDLVERNRLLAQALGGLNFGSLFAIFIAGPLIFYPLSRNAILTYANAVLEGAPISIAAAYRASFGKWTAQVVAALGYFVIEFAVIFCILLAALVIVALIVAAAALVGGNRGTPTVGAIVVLVFGVAFIIVGLLGFALLNVAFELSSISVALEEPNPFRAIGNGWRRTFDRALLRRTIGVALAYLAVQALGTGGMLAIGALINALTHSVILQSVVSAVANVVILGVLAVFMLVYALDVRMRREGLDLLRAASDPSPAP